jgi:serine/threonine protein kinase
VLSGINHENAGMSDTDSDYALPPGFRLEEFEIVKLLGKGGFGLAYLAYDHVLKQQRVIKEFLPTSVAQRDRGGCRVCTRSGSDQEIFTDWRDGFINEARLLASLDHPNVVRVYRCLEANGTAYMVMHYYQGETLSQRLQQWGEARPDAAWVRNLLIQLLHGLDAVHSHAILHRDIKPTNIYILADDRPVLLDFGAAQRLESGLTKALTGVVSHGFSPLELYTSERDLNEGPWSDLYSLGATFYEIVTGCSPMNVLTRVAGRDLPPALTTGQSWYPASLLGSIDRALEIRPDARYQTAGEWLAALEDTTAHPAPSRRLKPMIGIAVILLMLASGGYLAWQGFQLPTMSPITHSDSTPPAMSASIPKPSSAKPTSMDLTSPAAISSQPPVYRSIPAPTSPQSPADQGESKAENQPQRDQTITIFMQGDRGTEYSGHIEVTSVNGTTRSISTEGAVPKTYTLKGVKVSAVFRKKANDSSTLMASITDEKMYPEPVMIKKTANSYGMLNISLSSK